LLAKPRRRARPWAMARRGLSSMRRGAETKKGHGVALARQRARPTSSISSWTEGQWRSTALVGDDQNGTSFQPVRQYRRDRRRPHHDAKSEGTHRHARLHHQGHCDGHRFRRNDRLHTAGIHCARGRLADGEGGEYVSLLWRPDFFTPTKAAGAFLLLPFGSIRSSSQEGCLSFPKSYTHLVSLTGTEVSSAQDHILDSLVTPCREPIARASFPLWHGYCRPPGSQGSITYGPRISRYDVRCWSDLPRP
jgi:hypothetical protein